MAILVNPPVSRDDIIIDKYLNGDAAYICFWTVTDVRGGETDAVMDLMGAGNIYVGGGSASVADRAVADGEGNNIVQRYATKASLDSLSESLNTVSLACDNNGDSIRELSASLDGKANPSEVGSRIGISWAPSENGVNPYKLNLYLNNHEGRALSTAQIDFPLEQMVVNAEYDEPSKSLVLNTLEGYITVPVSDIFRGLVTDTNIMNKKAGYAGEADYASKALSFIRSDGSNASMESVEAKAIAASARANEAYSLAEEAKSLAEGVTVDSDFRGELDALSQSQIDLEDSLKNGDFTVHTAKYAPGNKVYTLENAIRNIVFSQGKLSLLRFNAPESSVNLLTHDFVSSLADSLAENTDFINLIVDKVLAELGY